MMLLLKLFVLLCGLELLMWTPLLWRYRKAYSSLLMVSISVVYAGLMANDLKLWTVILAAIGLYRLINLKRIFIGKTQPDYLYHSSYKTYVWIMGLQVITLVSTWVVSSIGATSLSMFYLLALAQLAFAAVLMTSTLRRLRTTIAPTIKATHADHDLPSLTVAIPARNETSDLEGCLNSLIASKYPKLEVLVLDDCSQNKRTPEIIRGFAHDGVRFIAGKTPPEKWLAKNYAYQQLLEAASGELMLFCGVDVRFEPNSLNTLVETMLQKKKSMISIIPINLRPLGWKFTKLFTQPNRYAWEIMLPRKLFKRPAVLSTCWLITRQALQTGGGFAAVIRQPVPESHFARVTAQSGDGYSFMQSSHSMGITSHKDFYKQLNTAVRTRYPQLHRRPELVLLTTAAEFVALVWPLILVIVGLLSGIWALALISGAALIAQAFTYSQVEQLTYRKQALRSVWLSVPAALYDIWLLNYSMWQYEFSEVLWKGRNVCIPVMRVLPNLPKS